MLDISDKDFERMVGEAVASTPKPYADRLANVAFIIEDEPTPEQRHKLQMVEGQLLFGLYEGVPLPGRGGATKLLPDKITLFKNPLLAVSRDEHELKEHIGRTVWHEIAHYFGLDHKRIHELER